MVLEMFMGSAMVGLFSGALVSQFSNRIANKTIDVAVEEVERVMARLRGSKPGDPETKFVLRTLHDHELEERVKLATVIVEGLQDDPNPAVRVCVDVLNKTLQEIKEILRDIYVELDEHKKRWLGDLRFSDVRPMLDVLKDKMEFLSLKIDVCLKVKIASPMRGDVSNLIDRGGNKPQMEA